MKLSLNWLKKYVDLPEDLTLEKLAYDLTMRTVEVEGYEDLGEKYNNIVAGVIKSVESHPNADKLRVCMVDVGDEELQIVCGGSNLYVGEKVVISKIGSMVIWHGEGEPVEIKKTKMRGVLSYGMICGADEVGLTELFPPKAESEIVDLGDMELSPGDNIADLLGMRDWILEIDNKSLTNRPDLYCHYGMARELSAIYNTELKPLPKVYPENLPKYPVEIEDGNVTRRFIALKIENINLEPSPEWMQNALNACGMRPINNVVDITNYVMLAVGNPTHAYDYDMVKEKIVARFAREGETLTLLDNTVLNLNDKNLVIADGEKVLGLAGIMGGIEDSILDTTKTIILEIANFDAGIVRKTLKQYDLRTEAGTRFEKNIDTERASEALSLALSLFNEIIPNAKITEFTDNYPLNTGNAEVKVSLDFLNVRLGREVSATEVKNLLEPLGFEVEENSGIFDITVPSWRSTGDIKIPDDILEEVARMIGYDNFETEIPKVDLNPLINQRDFQTEREIKEYLAFSAGFYEIFTYPWVEDEFIKASRMDDEYFLEISNPPSPSSRRLRNSLIPGILWGCSVNEKHFEDFKIFEVGKVFLEALVSQSIDEEKLPLEEKHLSLAIYGKDVEEMFFEMKGVIAGLNDLRISPLSFSREEKPKWADKDLWLNINTGEKIIGAIGALSVKGLQDMGVKTGKILLAELNLSEILPTLSRENSFTKLEVYPEVENDLAVICDEETDWADIERVVSPLVKDLKFVEEYRGNQVPEGKKSITFRFKMLSAEGTLTQEDIEKKRSKILRKLSGQLGAELRE